MNSMPFVPITPEEFARIERETVERDAREPRVKGAHFEAQTGKLVLEMQGNISLSLPARKLKALSDAKDEQIAQVRVVSNGNALFWDDIDVQMTTVAIIKLIFGIETSSDVARRAGSVTSVQKTAAARLNGKKGGRPKKIHS